MFIGEYDHRLDNKNRLSVPRKFREVLKSTEDVQGFFVTRGLDTCLFLYTASQWNEAKANLKDKPFTGLAVRRFQRLFFGNASFCELDKQGRILIPEKLREVAQLEKNVTVVGVDSRVEVWSRSRWESAKEADSSEYEKLAEELF